MEIRTQFLQELNYFSSLLEPPPMLQPQFKHLLIAYYMMRALW